jgi:NAD+ synthase
MTHALHITLAQINPVVGDLEYNSGKIRDIRDTSKTDLIVFPELAICGYSPEDLILRPFFMDRVHETVEQLIRESTGKPAIILPSPWRMNGQTFNVAHLIADGRILATVRKHHLPNYRVFDEQRVFTAGPLPSPVEFKGHKLGIMVCEDMWHADVASALRDQGAEILIVSNASPYEAVKHDTRITLARDRTQETGLPLIYINLWGGQDEIVFDGASFVMNAGGTVIVQAEEFAEDIHHTIWEKNPGGVFLCLTDTTHPRHEETESIYQVVMTGLRDYVHKNGFTGVLLGLSGGVDSALVAALAVDALGADAVHGVMMPSRYTSKDSIEDAEALAKALGIRCDTIAIEQPVEAFNHILAPHLTASTPSITFENLQSRSRGLILMALSNATGRMVLSTGNKSEMAVGYATLYGDMCGGFNPLKDVYKTLVYALCHLRNAKKPNHCLGPKGQIIPDRILTKAPTAELKPGQTDQDSLPPYDVLDDILHGLIEQNLAIEDIPHDRATVVRVSKMLKQAEYKRRQAPPGVKITSLSFGRERRYPITNGFLEN